jgi:hypothetical protein
VKSYLGANGIRVLLDLFGYVKPDAAGGGLDCAHRITGGLSAFAQG